MKLVGWRYGVFIGAIVGSIGIAIYPIIIYPYFNVDKYKKIQAETRGHIVQADIQPGEMKVWKDPFDRKKQS